MNIFGIGPLEVVFLVVIALIVLGPKDLVKAGRTIGRVLRQLVMSENWRAITEASREMRNLPNRLMREAGLEDMGKDLPNMTTLRKELGVDEIKQDMQKVQKDLSEWTTPPTIAQDSPGSTSGDAPEPPPDARPVNPPSAGQPAPADPNPPSSDTQP